MAGLGWHALGPLRCGHSGRAYAQRGATAFDLQPGAFRGTCGDSIHFIDYRGLGIRSRGPPIAPSGIRISRAPQRGQTDAGGNLRPQ